MKKSLILLLILFWYTPQAQEIEEDAIMDVVNQVFEAMRTNDSTLLKDCFVEVPAMYTVYKNKEGITNFVKDDFGGFIKAVGKPKEQVWNEPIWNEKIEIDGSLASVWVDYAFYVNDQFSHCGVDAFHLVKLENQWRIFHLVDTRRRSDCTIPEEIKP